MRGKIIEKDALILRHNVGTAEGKDGNSYEMTNSINMAPLIKSEKTGKTFSLSWSDIIAMAIEAGIDKEQ
jgi:hypothetical protein